MNKKFLLLLFTTNAIQLTYPHELTCRPFPVHHAVNNNDIAGLFFCFRAGCNLDLQLPETGKSPLHCAVSNNQLFAAQQLLEHGCDPNLRDEFQDRAIDDAIFYNRPEILKLLFQYSNPNINLETGESLFEKALNYLNTENNSSCIRALMENKEFDTAVHIEKAIMSGNLQGAHIMQQWLNQQRQPDRITARLQLERQATQGNDAPEAKRQCLEICPCCQEPMDDTDNPGTQIFQCSHYLHEGCWQGLESNGYTTCLICQAPLAQQAENGTTQVLRQKTAAELEQEENDAMIASLLAAGIINPADLQY